MNLIESIQTKDTTTENGMPTNTTSLNRCVDLFFLIGAMRGDHPKRILHKFIKAYHENPLAALRILFWVRDIRGGAGERRTFRIIWEWLCNNHPEIAIKNLSNVDYFGRWDDHLVGLGSSLEYDIVSRIQNAIELENKLAAKWMPRRGKFANILRKGFKMSPKEYRKFLVENTTVVETLMCSNQWDSIDYSKIPSLSMSRYSSAFKYHSGEKFRLFIEELKLGKTKINVGALYPYDVIKNLKLGEVDSAIEQWNRLPNFMEECREYILPLIDTSGSMSSHQLGQNLNALDVAISLGIYISEKNVGQFKDYFMTFSHKPVLQHLVGNLYERYYQLNRAQWDMSTNLESVFRRILTSAVDNGVSISDMPSKILIISDMEFNQCIHNPNDSVMNMIEKEYITNGYKVPEIVFWNLVSRHDNIPVKFDKKGTALISGFSPSILKSVLNMNEMTPVDIMLTTINNSRYSSINI